MTEEQIQQIAQLILAEWEFSGPEPGKCMLEGWSPEKVWRASTPFGQRAATGIARKIAPLVLASMKCRDAAASCCRIIAKHGLVDEIEMEYRGFGADVDAALKSWLGWGEGEKSDQRIKV